MYNFFENALQEGDCWLPMVTENIIIVFFLLVRRLYDYLLYIWALSKDNAGIAYMRRIYTYNIMLNWMKANRI